MMKKKGYKEGGTHEQMCSIRAGRVLQAREDRVVADDRNSIVLGFD